jgi:hypothetical protein
MERHRLVGLGRLVGGRRCRHDPRIAVKLVHATMIFSITQESRPDHSTVTDLARLRDWSTSLPITAAV